MRTCLSTCYYGLLLKALPLTSPLSRLTMTRTNTSKAKVDQLQQLIHSGGWDKCLEKGVTPWDLGQPTPILVHLHQTGTLPKGRALVPGCGTGLDVVAIACPERFVVGLDVSENAIKQATKLFSSSKSEKFSFLEADSSTGVPLNCLILSLTTRKIGMTMGFSSYEMTSCVTALLSNWQFLLCH